MLLFKAASGEDGAGEGGGMLLFWDGAKVCSLKTCSFAPLKKIHFFCSKMSFHFPVNACFEIIIFITGKQVNELASVIYFMYDIRYHSYDVSHRLFTKLNNITYYNN
jgi:hypothetical protein